MTNHPQVSLSDMYGITKLIEMRPEKLEFVLILSLAWILDFLVAGTFKAC